MSIVALKRNSRRFIVPISGSHGTSSAGRSSGFSLVGGHRNIGVVGATNLAKSVTRTPFRGNAPMGNGGCCGKYVVNVSNSGSCCANDAEIMKASVKNTAGMIDTRFKWMSGTYPNWWVQETVPNMSQSDHIKKKKEKAACGEMLSLDAGEVAASCGNIGMKRIGGIPHCNKTFTKDVKVAAESSKYTAVGLMKKNCLPAPANRQAFPMAYTGKDNCKVDYLTWQEAQAAGALPANFVG